MGELHLEIYVERIRREYKVELEVGAPKVSYRECPTQVAEFNYRHRKQTGGSGQYAHIVGRFEPLGEQRDSDFVFEETRRRWEDSQAVSAFDRAWFSRLPGQGSGGQVPGGRLESGG